MTRKEAQRRLAAALREQQAAREEVRTLNARVVEETSAPPSRYYPSGHAMPSGERRFSSGDRDRIQKIIDRAQRASDRLGAATADVVNLRRFLGEASTKAPVQHARKKSSAQLDREIAASMNGCRDCGRGRCGRSHATKKQPPRVAYRIQLTPSELKAVEFARGRYQWPDMLSAHATDGGLVAFTESEMWQWTDDVDSDTVGNHSPFPLASPAFAAKLQRFYDERV